MAGKWSKIVWRALNLKYSKVFPEYLSILLIATRRHTTENGFTKTINDLPFSKTAPHIFQWRFSIIIKELSPTFRELEVKSQKICRWNRSRMLKNFPGRPGGILLSYTLIFETFSFRCHVKQEPIENSVPGPARPLWTILPSNFERFLAVLTSPITPNCRFS